LCANRLCLYDNLLTGTLPQLAALTLLTILWLNNNKFSGAIPDLSHNTALFELWLDGNSLLGHTGTRCPGTSSGVIVSGDTYNPTGVQGLYTEISITTENDYPERDGRPAFSGQGYFIYYTSEYEVWAIGDVLGDTGAAMISYSDADHPLSIDAPWNEADSGGFVEAPSSFALSCAAAGLILNKAEERQVLINLFASTKGKKKWSKTDGWKTEAEDHCGWFGITCNDEGRVI